MSSDLQDPSSFSDLSRTESTFSESSSSSVAESQKGELEGRAISGKFPEDI